jgi:hypothetical protein
MVASDRKQINPKTGQFNGIFAGWPGKAFWRGIG